MEQILYLLCGNRPDGPFITVLMFQGLFVITLELITLFELLRILVYMGLSHINLLERP